MEESQKRRERLKLIRDQASDTAFDANIDRSGLTSGGLSNPFVEGETASTPTQNFAPRFDFYTDPMAAFSGSRRDNIIPEVTHGHSNMLPRPAYQSMTPGPRYQTPSVSPSVQRILQVPESHFNQSPLGRPMGFATPSGRPQGPAYQNMAPDSSYQTPGFNSPDQRNFQVSRGHFNQSSLGRPQGDPPIPWGGPGSAPPPNMPSGSNFNNPSIGQEGYPYYGRGRGQRYHSSSHYESSCGGSRYPDSGRGRGRSFSNSMGPGSRMGGRRGRSLGAVSAEARPDMYYRKEMVEDPWKMLTPVVWKDTHTKDDAANKSWLPESITNKKAKVSSVLPETSISQQSLAQYLASSFGGLSNEPST